ncbi:major facilitator superfamily domain-containing protein [Mycena galericulata]|nr:major facilitator superfamily domain-containing protein [Mycena galericulata]
MSDRGTRRHSNLAYIEDTNDAKPTFYLTYAEIKLLSIAGVRYFSECFLFLLAPVSTMLQYRLYGGESPPPGLQGFLKAGANIGAIIGQFAFGYLADALGRKAIYGKELMLVIFATIMCLTTPTGTHSSPDACLIYLSIFRILLGVGVGGDYPMSASITSDRAVLRKRGTMLAYIFSNQGWGSFVVSLATVVVLAAYKHVMNDERETSKVDGVWRIVVGLSLIPAFATLYQRLTLPEATRFIDSQKPKPNQGHDAGNTTEQKQKHERDDSVVDRVRSVEPEEEVRREKAHFKELLVYFRKWRHAKLLVGTCLCWFLLDIAFYRINLNQNVVLQEIGFAGKTGTPWEKLLKISTGNIIVTALDFVPGYYATVVTLGRKVIQIQGSLFAALFLAILAARFHTLSKPGFIVCFALLQFFFNLLIRATTYCYPAELFPTKFKALAHGLSAASGKCGAIISAPQSRTQIPT